jgi:signal transduction histidine kinase
VPAEGVAEHGGQGGSGGDRLVIEVGDDGDGGADPSRGTGLTGLLDRVEAGDGILRLSSPVGGGTTLHAELPIPGAEPPRADSG